MASVGQQWSLEAVVPAWQLVAEPEEHPLGGEPFVPEIWPSCHLSCPRGQWNVIWECPDTLLHLAHAPRQVVHQQSPEALGKSMQ